jgi:hypothetical protein
MKNTKLAILLTNENIHSAALMAATHWTMADESKRGLNLAITAEDFGKAAADVYISAAKRLIAVSDSEAAS